MKKNKRNNNRLTKVIRETLERLNTSHIEDTTYVFTPESVVAFGDMIGGLDDTLSDLGSIRDSEGAILVDTELYSEEYLEDIITDLLSVVDRLEHLKGLE